MVLTRLYASSSPFKCRWIARRTSSRTKAGSRLSSSSGDTTSTLGSKVTLDRLEGLDGMSMMADSSRDRLRVERRWADGGLEGEKEGRTGVDVDNDIAGRVNGWA